MIEELRKQEKAAIDSSMESKIEQQNNNLKRKKKPKSLWKRFKSLSLIRKTYAFVTTSFDLIRSAAIRVIFCLHSLLAIILVCFVRNELWYFVNTVGIVFMIIEFVTIALKNGGKDLFW